MREHTSDRKTWGWAGILAVIVAGLLIMAWPRSAPDAAANGAEANGNAGQRPRAQVGLASFYGPGLQGRRTASGDRFDQRKMTAAHRTLPLGTRVRVTNLKNGRAVEVLINDRGPYGRARQKGTIIDVSKGAAERLAFIPDGTTRVRVEVLGS